MARRKISKEWQQSDSEEEEDRLDMNEEEEDIPSDEGSEDQVVENEAKFAQFLDSDDENLEDDESESEESSKSISEEEDDFNSSNRLKNHSEEKNIRKRMESIPFAALAKAKRAIKKDEEEDEEDSELDEFEDDRTKAREKQEKKYQHLIEKRDNKHAPTELSSKRPVSRKRSVVDLSSNSSSSQRRDPRFSSLSGSLTNKGLFRSSYGFLREQQSNEVQELKKVLGKLKKQEKHQAGPRSKSESALRIRQEREDVERTLRRQEGLENERLKRERKDEVLRKAKKSIEDRVKQGGKRFFLKESEKKKLILQDKFQHLSGEGGVGASGSSKNDLKRAVERRRKKNSAKDRQMPLGGGAFQNGKQNGFGFGDGSMPMPKRKRARKE